MIKILLISLTISAIVAQIPHAYYTFIKASLLKGVSKKIQAAAFSIIVSVAIFTFVIIGRTELALFGAIIEVVINIYYWTQDFWDNGFGQKRQIRKHILIFWRKKWIYIFISFLMPIFIFIFSEILKEML